MKNKTTAYDKTMTEKLLCLEVDFIEHMAKVLRKNSIIKSDVCKLEEVMREYFFILCQKCMSIDLSVRTESILRVNRFLLTFPVRNNVNKMISLELYERLSIMYLSTYVLFQISAEIISSGEIDEYISYINGTKVEKLYTIYLYRVNPKHVKTKHRLYVTDLSKAELYHAVASGYYEIGKGNCEAINRLYSLEAYEEINKLKSDGFIID